MVVESCAACLPLGSEVDGNDRLVSQCPPGMTGARSRPSGAFPKLLLPRQCGAKAQAALNARFHHHRPPYESWLPEIVSGRHIFHIDGLARLSPFLYTSIYTAQSRAFPGQDNNNNHAVSQSSSITNLFLQVLFRFYLKPTLVVHLCRPVTRPIGSSVERLHIQIRRQEEEEEELCARFLLYVSPP